MTGLSVDTLRAWERRYEAVVPERGDRGRVYTDAHVARLKQLVDLVGRGHAIGSVAGLSDADLHRLMTSGDAHASGGGGASAEPPVNARFDGLLRALDRYDLDEIERNLNRHAAVLPPSDLIFSVMLPLLREVGARWEKRKLRPSQEHLVSAIVRSVLGSLLRTTGRITTTPKIVFATPSGERHELGLLCAALLAASAGYGVIYLGPDVPADDIVHAAVTTHTRVVMIAATAQGAISKAEARTLSRLPAEVELWIGGAEAEAVLAITGDRARYVEGLDDVVPMLSRHVG